MHEWMSDSGYTPHLVVNAQSPGVDVPGQYVEDGRIILNVSYSAAHNLDLGNEVVQFEARFSGTPCQVYVPMAAILGIYARETGQGMVFSEPEADAEQPPAAATGEPKPARQKRPNLRLIK